MNKIEAALRKTEFAASPHRVLVVDGVQLDLLLESRFPSRMMKGLVPTLLGWMDDQEESAIVWERILPGAGQRYVAPVLVCPDDLDFSCTVIVADVEGEQSSVRWRRLGIDVTPGPCVPRDIGTRVEWFLGIGPYEFHRAEYARCIDRFRR